MEISKSNKNFKIIENVNSKNALKENKIKKQRLNIGITERFANNLEIISIIIFVNNLVNDKEAMLMQQNMLLKW